MVMDLLFPSNSTPGSQQCFLLTILDDILKEADEVFVLTASVNCECISPVDAQVTITDSDSKFSG